MIEIRNLTTSQIDESFIKKIAEIVFKEENVKKETELSIAFIGSGRMRKLNKIWRNKNRATDILAFPELKVACEKFRLGKSSKIAVIGEIVICLREIKKNAKRFKTSANKELARVIAHGILHLLGYDHEKSEEKAERMRKREEEYIKKIERFN